MLTALALAICVMPAEAGNADAATTAPDRAEVFAQGLADLSAIEGRVRAHPDSLGPRLDRLRVLFVLGVKEQEYLDEAAKAVGRLEERGDLGAETSNLVRAPGWTFPRPDPPAPPTWCAPIGERCAWCGPSMDSVPAARWSISRSACPRWIPPWLRLRIKPKYATCVW